MGGLSDRERFGALPSPLYRAHAKPDQREQPASARAPAHATTTTEHSCCHHQRSTRISSVRPLLPSIYSPSPHSHLTLSFSPRRRICCSLNDRCTRACIPSNVECDRCDRRLPTWPSRDVRITPILPIFTCCHRAHHCMPLLSLF
jgi:hypothetical protein